MTISPSRLLPRHGHDSVFMGSLPIMNAISHEIEDVVIEHGLAVDMYAGFQRFSHLARQPERYQQLARACRQIYVWGIPDTPPPDIHNIHYIPLAEDTELAHEWFLVVDSPGFFTALLAQESTPGLAVAPTDQCFEGIWTHDSHLVGQAVAMAAQLLGRSYAPVQRRNYEEQSQYLALISLRLMQRREQYAIERVLSQHRSAILQSVLASSETPLLLLDAQKIVIAASQSACTLLKERAAAIVGKPLRQCGNGLFVQRDPTHAGACQTTLLHVSNEELLGANSRPITDADGATIGWVITLHHVKHQRMRVPRPNLPIESCLQGYCEELQQQLAILPSLLSRPEGHQRAIMHTQRLVDQLSIQIQRLSLLNEIEARGEAQMTSVKVGPLLHPLFEEGRISARSHGLMLLLDVPDGLPMAWCDANLVQLALRELLDNLVKHAQGCTIARLRASQEHGYISLSVQDNGCGMDRAAQENIFNPFSRTKAPLAADKPIGLGLALARAVAKVHHGHLRINSIPGRGCNVTLMLPALT